MKIYNRELGQNLTTSVPMVSRNIATAGTSPQKGRLLLSMQ